jgi:4-aminobutyrate aminotransferase-like enzyme
LKTKTQRTLDLLREYESRNITFIDPEGGWPIVWERARGQSVRDADGRRYLDLTAAFGVAACGHANPRVVRAGQKQMGRLLHAMGDVHPHALKGRLAQELSRLTFGRWRPEGNTRGKTIFCNSGFEAVEAALKTALLATGRSGVIAFEGAYHGVGYGALNATHRAHFRAPFLAQLAQFGVFVPFPAAEQFRVPNRRGAARPPVDAVESRVRRLLQTRDIGAVLVEPVQVRGGVNIPGSAFLPMLRSLCDEFGALLVLDEIYTGLGRTGKWFACEHFGVVPDLVCLGKALSGGFPLSACVGRAPLMDAAWPPAQGEAIHTSTFLGHPVGCAMALAQIEELRSRDLVRQSAARGAFLLAGLEAMPDHWELSGGTELFIAARGLGLLAGLELRRAQGTPATQQSLRVIQELLARGFILLPEGEHANVISFTPPLTISERQLAAVLTALRAVLERLA